MELRGTTNNKDASSIFKSIDWTTLLLYFIMVVYGVVSIYAATYDFDHASMFSFSEFSGKQFMWIGISFLAGLSMLLIDKRLYEAYAYPIYGLLILLLIVTIFVAPDINGSRSWIVFGPVSLQPAEFAKFATALALAKLFSSYNFVLNKSLGNYLKCAFIIGLPILLILIQKETGSALVYFSLVFVLYREGMTGFVVFIAACAITFFVVAIKFAETTILGIATGMFSVLVIILLIAIAMLFIYCKSFILGRNVLIGNILAAITAAILHFCDIQVNGYWYFGAVYSAMIIYLLVSMFKDNLKRIIITISFIVGSVIFLFSVNYMFETGLKSYQQKRIKVALGVEKDLKGVGYNVNQAKIAIGSGGFIGKGFLNGTQTKLRYVPEHHTDFIFCTIGEEQGFVGSMAVLGLFLALILRIIFLAERQRTAFGRIYAYCVASIFMMHLIINIGMVIGLCPVIGIPLPFFSYGGSSMLGFTILLFILLRLDASRREYSY